MIVTGVDERDSSWEDHEPRFRVYLFKGGETPHSSWATQTYDVTDADVLDVIRWAQQQAGRERLYAVALVGDHGPDAGEHARGLTWLVGKDANDVIEDEQDRRCVAGMLARREKPAVSDP